MSARVRRVAAGVAILLLSTLACTPKKISDIDSGTSSTVVDGIAVPYGVSVDAAQRHLASVHGLYPSSLAHDRDCCWIAPDATIVALKSRVATTVSATVFVPDLPFFAHGGQTVTIRAGAAIQRLPHLLPGSYVLSVPLNPVERDRTGPVILEIHSDRTFVPVREHFNADTRELGVVLLGVTFQ